MKINNLHRWNVNVKSARQIQLSLREKLVLKDNFERIEIIAGCDVSFDREENKACAAICLFRFEDLKFLCSFSCISEIKFPYIPGLLSFREAPALIKVLKKINTKIDLLIFDGQGVAHPLNMGLASHMGLITGLPAIGCAKSRLYGKIKKFPANTRGAATALYDKKGKIIGKVLRTREKVNPVFVSSGHKISLNTSQKVVLRCCKGFRLPEPVRCAHILSRKVIKSR